MVSKKTIQTGNALEDGKNSRGWIVGSFLENAGLRSSKDIEIKFCYHPKGEVRESKAVEGEATTIGILVRGKFKIIFENRQESLLTREGDYVIWHPNIAHRNEVFEDTLFVTVRWPSLSAKKN